jgi:hypothetical protein
MVVVSTSGEVLSHVLLQDGRARRPGLWRSLLEEPLEPLNAALVSTALHLELQQLLLQLVVCRDHDGELARELLCGR